MPRIAVLDDYQGVALSSADWSAVQARAEVSVFRDHLAERTTRWWSGCCRSTRSASCGSARR